MPRKGYNSVTLKDEEIVNIDGLVNKEEPTLKSRSKVISLAIKQFKEVRT